MGDRETSQKSYFIRRLKRDAPELAERVDKGELSLRAAMVEAGVTPRMAHHPATVGGFLKAIHQHLSEHDRAILKDRL